MASLGFFGASFVSPWGVLEVSLGVPRGVLGAFLEASLVRPSGVLGAGVPPEILDLPKMHLYPIFRHKNDFFTPCFAIFFP